MIFKMQCNAMLAVRLNKRFAHGEERCVIVVTHDAAIADEADEALRMKDGRIEGMEGSAGCAKGGPGGQPLFPAI